MRIINQPELEVTFSREDIEELYDFFSNHFLIPNMQYTGKRPSYPVYDKLVNIFKLLIDEKTQQGIK